MGAPQDPGDGSKDVPVGYPSQVQLRKHFVQSAVPMIGFGFMDNTVMIHAGSAIDATFGVTLGLSTMCAAACGQICSDMAGVSFGGIIEATASKLGLPSPSFAPGQRGMPVVKRVGVFGGVVGVFMGCSMGLVNLLFVDTERHREFVLAQQEDLDDTCYSVSISNTKRDDVTTIFVDGPAQQGLIASVIQKINGLGFGIHGMDVKLSHASEFGTCASKHREFLVTRNGEQIPDEDLHEIAQKILHSCRNPARHKKMSMALEQAQKENEDFRKQNQRLKDKLEELLISVDKRPSQSPCKLQDS